MKTTVKCAIKYKFINWNVVADFTDNLRDYIIDMNLIATAQAR